MGIVDAGRPVEHAGHLPARVAGTVAGDPLHRLDQLVVEDAAIVRAGDGAQFDAAVLDLQRLHLLGAVRGQAVLQIDAGERGRELAQIGGRCADQARQLAEAPVCRCDGHVAPGRISVSRSASSRLASTRIASLSTMRVRLRSDRVLDRRLEVGQGQVALVVRPVEPFRRHAADTLAAADIHLVARLSVRTGRLIVIWVMGFASATGAGSLSPSL